MSESEAAAGRKTDKEEVKGEQVEINKDGVQYVEGEQVTLDKSGALTIKATQAALNQSGAGILVGEQISMDESSSAGVMLAERVNAVRVNCGVLLAGEVYGNVETAVDTRGALLIGLGVGVGLGLLLSLKSLFGKE